MSRKGRCCKVYDAEFVAQNGQRFAFGYKAGVAWAMDPLGDLPVELETAQGYQQVGVTVESRSIGGVTRTVTGRIWRNADYCKRQLRDIFAPFIAGRFTVEGKYYIDVEVQRGVDISAASRWPTFTFELFCPEPYWHSVSETSASTLHVTPAFQLPASYTTHQYGLRELSEAVAITNTGLDTRTFVLTLIAHGTVQNPGVLDLTTGEYLRFEAEMLEGDSIKVWREDGRLRIERTIDDVSNNAFALLDESSSLWTLRHGAQAWQRTADSGVENLYLTVAYNAAFAALVVEGST